MTTKIPASTLDELLRFLQSPAARDLPNGAWTHLPTFGGDEPDDTSGVWSWDERRVLVGSCATDLRITDRPRRPWTLRLRDDEIDTIEAAAKRAGRPATTWARDVLLRAARG